MKCKHCGYDNLADAKFCESCGKPVEKQQFCRHCGSALISTSNECPNCGTTRNNAPNSNKISNGDKRSISSNVFLWLPIIPAVILLLLSFGKWVEMPSQSVLGYQVTEKTSYSIYELPNCIERLDNLTLGTSDLSNLSAMCKSFSVILIIASVLLIASLILHFLRKKGSRIVGTIANAAFLWVSAITCIYISSINGNVKSEFGANVNVLQPSIIVYATILFSIITCIALWVSSKRLPQLANIQKAKTSHIKRPFKDEGEQLYSLWKMALFCICIGVKLFINANQIGYSPITVLANMTAVLYAVWIVISIHPVMRSAWRSGTVRASVVYGTTVILGGVSLLIYLISIMSGTYYMRNVMEGSMNLNGNLLINLIYIFCSAAQIAIAGTAFLENKKQIQDTNPKENNTGLIKLSSVLFGFTIVVFVVSILFVKRDYMPFYDFKLIYFSCFPTIAICINAIYIFKKFFLKDLVHTISPLAFWSSIALNGCSLLSYIIVVSQFRKFYDSDILFIVISMVFLMLLAFSILFVIIYLKQNSKASSKKTIQQIKN